MNSLFLRFHAMLTIQITRRAWEGISITMFYASAVFNVEVTNVEALNPMC